MALQFIEKQTEEMCLQAICQTEMDYQFVKNPTHQMKLVLAKQNGMMLANIKEQMPEICLEVVKQNEFAINFVKDQTEEGRRFAVR